MTGNPKKLIDNNTTIEWPLPKKFTQKVTKKGHSNTLEYFSATKALSEKILDKHYNVLA